MHNYYCNTIQNPTCYTPSGKKYIHYYKNLNNIIIVVFWVSYIIIKLYAKFNLKIVMNKNKITI